MKKTNRNPTQRQLRIGELIRHEISDFLLRGNFHDEHLSKTSITVSQVVISGDLRWGKVYISPLGGLDTVNVVKSLNDNVKRIQGYIASKIHLKRMPKLIFYEDTSFDFAKKINEKIYSLYKVN
tara:strand:- start:915 stop:1286 length:372 start_codon:yes stop_codon:yes gene_type:complete